MRLGSVNNVHMEGAFVNRLQAARRTRQTSLLLSKHLAQRRTSDQERKEKI